MANNMTNGNNRRPCQQSPVYVSSKDNVSMSVPARDLHVVRSTGTNGSNDDVSCKELMKAIMEADFMATDLKLYLDIHPDDEKALELYRDAVRQYKACKATFEDTFYPLTATSAGRDGTWDWIDGTFPPML